MTVKRLFDVYCTYPNSEQYHSMDESLRNEIQNNVFLFLDFSQKMRITSSLM